VHRRRREREAVAGCEPVLTVIDLEADLAEDHPQDLVVIVPVRVVRRAGFVVPQQYLETFSLEALPEEPLHRSARLVPRDTFELHRFSWSSVHAGDAHARRVATGASPAISPTDMVNGLVQRALQGVVAEDRRRQLPSRDIASSDDIGHCAAHRRDRERAEN